MNILTFSDLHLNNNNSYGRINADGFNSVLLEQLSAVYHMLENDSDITLFAGDFCDKPNVDPKVGYVISSIISKLAKRKNVVIIPGNHDFDDSTYKTSVIYNYGFFNNKKKNRFFVGIDGDSFDVVELENNVLVFCVSGTTKYKEDFQRAVKESKKFSSKKYNKIFLGHFPVKGAYWDGGEAFEGVEASAFRKYGKLFKFFVLGDFHKSQKIVTNKNAFYCGSLTHTNFRYSGLDMGFQTIEDWNNINFHKTPFLRFVKYSIPNVEAIPEVFTKPKKCHRLHKGTYVKVSYSCDYSKVSFIKELLQRCELNYLFFGKVGTKKEIVKEDVSITKINIKDSVKKYVKSNYDKKCGIKSSEFVSKGIEYLEI